MNKLCKIFTMLAVMMIVISMSLSAQAYTNEDVISYVTKAHTVNGRTVQLSDSQRESLKKYLQANPVAETKANEIIAKLDSAKSKLDNSGATNLSQVSASLKAEVVALVKEAGNIAGLTVEVDTKNETVTIKDAKGNPVINSTSYSEYNSDLGNSTSGNSTSSTTTNNPTSNKLVYTGRDYTVVIKTIVAIVAIAIVGVIVTKNAK